MNIVIAIDPSGNFTEGQGHTGIAIFNKDTKAVQYVTEIKAEHYCNRCDYWQAILKFLQLQLVRYHINDKGLHTLTVVVEDYLLYADKLEAQTYSKCETPRLLGILEYWCYSRNIPIVFQTAALVKKRWSNEILLHKGILTKENKCYRFDGEPISEHCRDAIRHGMHYITFKGAEDNGRPEHKARLK